jgi:hypothetical protein
MARYIDADKLREYWLENGVNENVYNTNNVLDSIDYQSTADVVEVVRCKDCKHWHKKVFDPIIEHHIGECHCSQWENDYFWYETSENDFCSYGERRDT